MSKKRKADSLPTAGSDFGGAAKPLKTEHKDFASSEPNPKKLRKAETDELTTTPNIEATNKKRRGPPNPLARKYGHHVHGPAKGAPPGGASGIKKRIRDTERLLKKVRIYKILTRNLFPSTGANQIFPPFYLDQPSCKHASGPGTPTKSTEHRFEQIKTIRFGGKVA